VEGPATSPWKERTVGRDRALVRVLGTASMAFGIGPARGSARDPDRLEAVLGDRVTSLRHCRQVHGRTIHRVAADLRPVADVGPGDGLVCSETGVGLVVWTADCVPVLLVADGVVAAVHSGWRGCAADVVGAAIEEMERSRGCTPDWLNVALGPSVCGPCYEVGSEVPEALDRFGLDERRWLDGTHVDLRGFLTARLERLGVPAENIESVGGCTVESPDLASYRRDGAAAGRQWSMVVLNGLEISPQRREGRQDITRILLAGSVSWNQVTEPADCDALRSLRLRGEPALF